ncbi:vesicular glutamate transporter 2-like [Lineus longissimus]|uniref:vesicular glutamate transporter 2-like n=1 Tax=Lineus longissimus TaxID=88925 RepID=UPI002B4CDCB5
MCCKAFYRLFPKRYFLALLGFTLLCLGFGMRTVFNLTIVHLVTTNVTDGNCPNMTGDWCKLPADQIIVWDSATTGNVLSAYYYGYVITQIPGGLLAQRYAAYKVFGGSLFISFLLFLIIPFTMHIHWSIPFTVRVVQGLVEGATMPAINGVLAHWARSSEKSRILTTMTSGAYLSAAVGLGLTGVVTCSTGDWRNIFFIFTGAGVFVCIVWFITIRESPTNDPVIGTIEKTNFMKSITGKAKSAGANQALSTPWKAIFTSPPIWAIFVASFCRCWILYLLITEQPQYFRDAFCLNLDTLGGLSALPHICMTIVVLFGGILADTLMKKKILSRTATRKIFNCGGFGIEACCLLGLSFIGTSQQWSALAVLTVGVAFSGFAISGYQVNPHDLAPERAGLIAGIVKIGGIAGIIMPNVVQLMTKGHTIQEWAIVFQMSAGIHLGGVLFYAIFASGKRQPWSDTPEHKTLVSQPAEGGPEQIAGEIDAWGDDDESTSILNDGYRTSDTQWYSSITHY